VVASRRSGDSHENSTALGGMCRKSFAGEGEGKKEGGKGREDRGERGEEGCEEGVGGQGRGEGLGKQRGKRDSKRWEGRGGVGQLPSPEEGRPCGITLI